MISQEIRTPVVEPDNQQCYTVTDLRTINTTNKTEMGMCHS